jgi:hypothetical protein
MSAAPTAVTASFLRNAGQQLKNSRHDNTTILPHTASDQYLFYQSFSDPSIVTVYASNAA